MAAAASLLLLTGVTGCSPGAAATPPLPSSTVQVPRFPAMPCAAADVTCLAALASASGAHVLGPPTTADAEITRPTLVAPAVTARIPGAVTFTVLLPDGATYDVREVGANEKTGPFPVFRRGPVQVRGVTGSVGLGLPRHAWLSWYEHGRVTTLSVDKPVGDAATVTRQLLDEASGFVWY